MKRKKLLTTTVLVILAAIFSKAYAQTEGYEMTFTIDKPIGSEVTISIVPESKDEKIVLEGLEGEFKNLQTYILTSQTVKVKGKVKKFVNMKKSITSIDVTKMPSLKILYVGYNKIGSIDLSNCPNLEELNIGSNNLTTIDISHNTKMIFLDVSDNNITELDCSHQTAGFYYLYCHSNKIKGEKMTELVNSLANANDPGYSFFVCIDTTDPYEENVALKSDVIIAMEKQYNVTDYQGGVVNNGDGVPYEGSDATQKAVTFVTQNIGDTIYVYAEANGELTQEGIDELEETKVFDGKTHHAYKVIGGAGSIDGEITTLSIQNSNVTSLDLSSETLSKLTCKGNALRQMNMSKCPALKEFDCSNNQILSFNVKENPLLETLNCENNIYLGEIETSNNPALKTLRCGHSYFLSSINVSNNKELETLACEGTTNLNKIIVAPDGKLNNILMVCCGMNVKKNNDDFFNSLPNVPTKDGKLFYIASNQGDTERNTATDVNVKMAREKGWNVYDLNPEDNTFTEYEGTATGIGEVTKQWSGMSFHGNILHVFGTKANCNASIVNANGATVGKASADAMGNMIIDMTNLPNGMYIIKTDDAVRKFIKR